MAAKSGCDVFLKIKKIRQHIFGENRNPSKTSIGSLNQAVEKFAKAAFLISEFIRHFLHAKRYRQFT